MADLEGRINLVGSNQPGSHMQAFSSSDAPPAPNLPLPPPGAPVRAYENTLNEPISETIMRDLRMIGYKLKYVLNPKMREERAQKLRDWDLWGPLILCLFLAMYALDALTCGLHLLGSSVSKTKLNLKAFLEQSSSSFGLAPLL
eukprot:TRINITY_DN2426_c0_g1_i4.p1 TRINITY_DN2426_c0_g1~~TRINITY_DN2426_c0_g1_i4.p1  ORF type:complete len:144 (+),score=20.77 TRINITY_DN2426_c0_g1_i4:154-585(+)